MKDNFKKVFNLKILLIIAVVVIIMIYLHYNFNKEIWYTWVVALVSSIVTSFIVSAFFQFSLVDEISKEHLSIMEYLNEKNKSGIVKYFGNFKDSIEEIRKELIKSKQVDIYLMYGSTILNTLSQEISYSLSKKENVINIYIMDEKNPFLQAFASIWEDKNSSYDENKLKSKIDDTVKLFREKKNELTKSNSLNGELNLYKNIKSPINYSFYLFDDKIYFVPSKNVSTKEFIPITILGQKTSESDSLYNKIKMELDLMKRDNNFTKIDIDEK